MRNIVRYLRPAAALMLLSFVFRYAVPETTAQTFETVLNTNLFQPASVAVSPDNHYFISDTANHRIVDFSADNRTFKVLAGPALSPFEPGAVDGQGIDARFRNPQGILCVGNRTFVADSGNHVIREIDANGNVTTIAGNLALAHEVDDYGGQPTNWGLLDGPAATAKFNAPCGLAADGQGHLYIADSGNHAIRMLDLNNNTVSTIVRSGLSNPVAVAVGKDGYLFISDSGLHSIKGWAPGTTKTVLLAGGGSALTRGFRNSSIATNALFSAPSGIYYREITDELIVADSGNSVLRTVQGISGGAPKVDTFANTGAAGFQTPIAVTRDLYGVFLVCDSTRNTLASVITVRFPRIEKPLVGYIVVIVNEITGLPEARLVPVTDQTFDNMVRIAVSGDAGAQHHFTQTGSISDLDTPPLPTTNSPTAVNFVQPTSPAPPEDVLNNQSLNAITPPRYNFRVKAFTAPKGVDERISSLMTEAVFRFKCGTPQLDSQSVPGRLLFRCNTTNAVVYYTMDGSDPIKGTATVKSLRSGDSIPLILTTNSFTIKARAYLDDRFIPSDVAKADFSPENFVPNRISLGFEDGEASTRMRAAPGQRYFTPVTLSLMPGAKAYGLQFDLSLEPINAPASRDYAMKFNSSFIEQTDFTNKTIPPSVFVLTGTNFFTNTVNEIVTNYTYEVTLTNVSALPSTNYLSFTNKLANSVPIITTNYIDNLGQRFPVLSTNYITNSFQFVSETSETHVTEEVSTNFLYRYQSPGVTNLVHLDHELPESSPVVVTNFVANLGQLFSFNSTNYITNSFNLVSSGVVTNATPSVETNYVYQAVTPAITNFVSLSEQVPADIQVILTNFVTNLGQLFPVTTTNRLSNAFDLVSRTLTTNWSTNSTTNIFYRAVSPGTTTYLALDRILPDRTPIVVTNMLTNLGQFFPVPSTNYLTNAFNLVSVDIRTNSQDEFTTNFVYEFGSTPQTNIVVLDHVLPDYTEVITTNLVPNLGSSFPVTTTNRITNAFNLVSTGYQTNVTTQVSSNFVYEVTTPAKSTFFEVDHYLVDRTLVLTTNFVVNLGQQFPVVTTNYISNQFNLFDAQILTNTTAVVSSKFDYRAVTPGNTNYLTFNRQLPDRTAVIVTNFVENLGTLFPVTTTNYISNRFNLVFSGVSTNEVTEVSSNYLYEAVTPGRTNIVRLDQALDDRTEVITTNFVSNMGRQFPVLSTNYISNNFNLASIEVTTNSLATVTTNFSYRAITPGTTNLITLKTILPKTVPVIVTNQISNLGQQFPVVQTNYLTNAFDLVSSSITTNNVSNVSTSYLYRSVSVPTTNYVTLDHFLPDVGPVVSSITATNLGQFFVLSSTNLAQNVFEFVSGQITTNVINRLSYEYGYSDIIFTNTLLWNGPIDDGSLVFSTNTFVVTNLAGGSVLRFPVTTTHVMAAEDFAGLVYDGGEMRYLYSIPTVLPGDVLISSIPVTFPDTVGIQASGYVAGANQTFSQEFVTLMANSLVSTNTNVVAIVDIKTNAVYRLRTPITTNYITLSTNLPDVAPVVSALTITNLGQNYTFAVTNYATNVFDLVSTIYSTNQQTVVTTNATYALRTPSITNIINLSTNLPDTAAIITTSFLTNQGQLFPVTTTNYLANTFEFIGTNYRTNTTRSVRTNVTYVFIEKPQTNYVFWPELLPVVSPVLTTNFISNLGIQFPVVQTNYLTNTFRLVSDQFATNTYTSIGSTFVYALTTPSVTNYLSLDTQLPDNAAVVTRTYLTNLNQLFPIDTTNYVANTFDYLGSRLSTNLIRTVVTNITYVLEEPAKTNYVFWPELLPPAAPVLTTNFVVNLGRQFPVIETNYVTNAFRLFSSGFTTNYATNISAQVVYEFRTSGSTDRIYWPERLPDVVGVVTTNLVSNLGRLFPVAVTNYLTNSFRLVDTVIENNRLTTVSTNVLYAFSTPSITNYLTLGQTLPDSLLVVTTNFISNLGQQFPVTSTNLLVNTFELLGTNINIQISSRVSTNLLYALQAPSVTNIVIWPKKLPDSVTIISTNFITNLGQFFPVLSTNVVANQFQLLYTNYDTSVALNVETNVWYEFHTAAVTNFFELDEKLPAFVQVITTNFVTNLGKLFPVRTTNITQNVFDLISTNVVTNKTTEIIPNYLYAFISPGGGGNGQFTISTNLLTLTAPLPEILPIRSVVGLVTNLNTIYEVYATNYVTNTFRLLAENLRTNSTRVLATNLADAFNDLVITNYSQNWLAVGWIETYGRTNLYNTIEHDLLSLSMPHTTTFESRKGEAVAGTFSFLIPTNAVNGDTYRVAVTRPSATADGINQDMFIQAPEEDDLKSPVKAVKTLVVTNRLSYIAGDVSDFHWFNAGEFGDRSILNNDITELQRVIIYGLNAPPEDSDFLDAMDVCCYTEDGQDLSGIEFASSSVDLNRIAFGEGSRYAPLGRRPVATLAVNDLFVAFRRSLDPDLYWYERYWSNGTRQASIVPNTFRGKTTLSRQSVSATSLPVGPTVQSSQAPALTVFAGTTSGLPGKVVAVPVRVRVDGGYPLRTLMFNAHVETSDGVLVPTASLEVAPTDALGLPTVLLNEEPGRSGAAWLDTATAGILGEQVIGRVLFTVPVDAQPTSLYYVKVERASGSPNGVSLFPVRTGNGIIAMANRPTPVWNDGIPDAWRLKYFGTLNDMRSAAEVDADGDGLSNYEEYQLGTNPTDANDNLRLQAVANGHGLKLRFRTASGRMYKVEASASLQPGSWLPVLSNVAGTGNEIELPDPGGAHFFYYRVRLQD